VRPPVADGLAELLDHVLGRGVQGVSHAKA
jgi:hypothetical protein